MGLFSKSTEPDVVERALRREIDAARKSEGRLAADLVKWQSAVERRKAAAEALARDDGADDDKIDAAVASTGGAQDRVDNASASLASVRDALAVLEAKHAQEVDRAQRDQTASTIELLARELAEACEAMDKAAVVVANVTARAFPVAPEAGGLHQLAIICHTELPAASDLITRLLRERGRAVIAGTAPAILKTPDAGPNTPPTAAEPVTTQMFALRSIKWRDANGRQIVAQKFSDAFLTAAAAQRAVALKAVVPIDSELRRKHNNTYGGNPDPALALDLDAEPERQPVIDPILASAAFERVDRGPGIVLAIKAGGK